MPQLNTVYESDDLFPLFANRLLAKSRPEYEAYLAWSGFDPDDPPDPIALLSVTEGLRATDHLELFPCPSPDANWCYLNKFFVHGVRHVSLNAQLRINTLRPGEQLLAEFEDTNPYDPRAVALVTDDDRVQVGYVPRYLAREVRQLCSECDPSSLDLRVERVNPTAPLQQRLLCRMNACWPDDFSPCSGEEFQPIVSDVPVTSCSAPHA